MIYLKDNKIKESNKWIDSSIYVLTDFDRTLTTFDSESSWNLLIYNKNVPKEYASKCERLFEFYRPIEIDNTINESVKRSHMLNWWRSMLDLTKEYKIKESVIFDTLTTSMTLRNGTRSFLEEMNYRKIPVVIISGGSGDIIREYLLNCNLNYDNIYIHSNFLKVEDGIIIGSTDKIVHSLNKNEDELPENIKINISLRENPILFGDLISDTKMANERNREKALKIGFIGNETKESIKEYLNNFDVVCTNNTGFDEISRYIKVLKR